MKKYFHELTQANVDGLIKDEAMWGRIEKAYIQPEWCGYPKALAGVMGCWALTNTESRLVNKTFCKACPSSFMYKSIDNQKIKDFLDAEFQVDSGNLTRKREVLMVRQIGMYMIKKTHPKASLQSIAKFYGLDSHANVLHAINFVQNYKDTDKNFAKEINQIEAKFSVSTITPRDLDMMILSRKKAFGHFNFGASYRGGKLSLAGVASGHTLTVDKFTIHGVLTIGEAEPVHFGAVKDGETFELTYDTEAIDAKIKESNDD
jgi:hypothetical protein